MEFSRPEYWSGQPFLSPGDLPNPCLPNCRQILYQLGHKGSSRKLEWVVYPFSRGSSLPRNQTGVSCIAGGFFINWAIKLPHSVPFSLTHAHSSCNSKYLYVRSLDFTLYFLEPHHLLPDSLASSFTWSEHRWKDQPSHGNTSIWPFGAG